MPPSCLHTDNFLCLSGFVFWIPEPDKKNWAMAWLHTLLTLPLNVLKHKTFQNRQVEILPMAVFILWRVEFNSPSGNAAKVTHTRTYSTRHTLFLPFHSQIHHSLSLSHIQIYTHTGTVSIHMGSGAVMIFRLWPILHIYSLLRLSEAYLSYQQDTQAVSQVAREVAQRPGCLWVSVCMCVCVSE